MAIAPAKLCNYSGCNAHAVRHGKCQNHQAKVITVSIPRQRTKDTRPSAWQRGYDSRWNVARLNFLDEQPLCKHCEDKGLVVGATIVDHIIPHRGNQQRFWDITNWQPLCKSCHDIKTATTDRKLTTALLPIGDRDGVGKN